MYVMTTEIWPFGDYQGKRSVLQIIGYNTQRFNEDGCIWYENIVADDSSGDVNSPEEIMAAFEAWRLENLKGISISVCHDRTKGMAALIKAILAEYDLKRSSKKELSFVKVERE